MSEWLVVAAGVAGLGALLWQLILWMHLPVFGDHMVSIVYVNGDGGELEQTVKRYGWLRCGGRLILADCGLNARGLDAAQLLQKRFSWVSYCPRQTLTDYLELTEDRI